MSAANPSSLPSPAFPGSRLHRLRQRHFLALRPRQPLCLRAERGSLWVTVDGRPEDFELDAGESHVFAAGERLTVGTLGGDAVFSATPQANAGWLARLPRGPLQLLHALRAPSAPPTTGLARVAA